MVSVHKEQDRQLGRVGAVCLLLDIRCQLRALHVSLHCHHSDQMGEPLQLDLLLARRVPLRLLAGVLPCLPLSERRPDCSAMPS